MHLIFFVDHSLDRDQEDVVLHKLGQHFEQYPHEK